MVIEWSEKYEIGEPEIDTQHKKLVDILNELGEAIEQKKGRKAVKHVLDELVEYTVYHFQTEEEHMQRIQYPDFKRHKLIHERLVRKVQEFVSLFEQGKDIEDELLLFLKHWLNSHILYIDKKISA